MENNIKFRLQDVFLNTLRKEHTPTIIYLTNGFQIRGTIKGFDEFTVIVQCDGTENEVYKGVISTICPIEKVNFIFNPTRSNIK